MTPMTTIANTGGIFPTVFALCCGVLLAYYYHSLRNIAKISTNAVNTPQSNTTKRRPKSTRNHKSKKRGSGGRKPSRGSKSNTRKNPNTNSNLNGSGNSNGNTHLSSHQKRWQNLTHNWLTDDGIILIDINNVRGHFGFPRATATEFCAILAVWLHGSHNQHNSSSTKVAARLQVIAEVDHGPSVSTHFHSSSTHNNTPTGGSSNGIGNGNLLMMNFAGRKLTADDVIVQDLHYFLEEGRNVLIVTSDKGLIGRLREVRNEYHQSEGHERVKNDVTRLRIVDSLCFSEVLDSSATSEDGPNTSPFELWQSNPNQYGLWYDGNSNVNDYGQPRKTTKVSRQKDYRFFETTQHRITQADVLFQLLSSPTESSASSTRPWFAAPSISTTPPGWHTDYVSWVNAGRPDSTAL